MIRRNQLRLILNLTILTFVWLGFLSALLSQQSTEVTSSRSVSSTNVVAQDQEEIPQAIAAESPINFTISEIDEGLEIKLNGELFTRYHTLLGAKPVLWPLIGPYGEEVTRRYPMEEDIEGERADHPHHRSMWFTHGEVNGISFWHENGNNGTIVHREFAEVEDGASATIKTINDWMTPDGNRVCVDERTLTFGADDSSRWIDFTITVTASDGEVEFGDTKEGSFGVRVAGSVKEDAQLGGRIMTSEGLSGSEAWGKPARWVDYHGPIGEQTVGIAILNHPESYGFPSHWHVRTYGLFAANPFGLHDFYGGESGKDGTLVLGEGDSFTLMYRLLIHSGDHEEGRVEASYENYVDGQ